MFSVVYDDLFTAGPPGLEFVVLTSFDDSMVSSRGESVIVVSARVNVIISDILVISDENESFGKAELMPVVLAFQGNGDMEGAWLSSKSCSN